MLLSLPWEFHVIYFIHSPSPSSMSLKFQQVLHYSSNSPCFKSLTCLSSPRLTGTYQGCRELGLRLCEQYALVHSSKATERLRRSHDTEEGTCGRKTDIWVEDQIHLTDRRERPEKSTSESHHVSLTHLWCRTILLDLTVVGVVLPEWGPFPSWTLPWLSRFCQTTVMVSKDAS